MDSGTVTTAGDGADGIAAFAGMGDDGSGTVSVTSESVSTSGDVSDGITAYGPGDITIVSGSVATIGHSRPMPSRRFPAAATSRSPAARSRRPGITAPVSSPYGDGDIESRQHRHHPDQRPLWLRRLCRLARLGVRHFRNDHHRGRRGYRHPRLSRRWRRRRHRDGGQRFGDDQRLRCLRNFRLQRTGRRERRQHRRGHDDGRRFRRHLRRGSPWRRRRCRQHGTDPDGRGRIPRNPCDVAESGIITIAAGTIVTTGDGSAGILVELAVEEDEEEDEEDEEEGEAVQAFALAAFAWRRRRSDPMAA